MITNSETIFYFSFGKKWINLALDLRKKISPNLDYPPMRTYFFLLVFLLSFSSNAFTQDNLATYKRGKTLIRYGNYSEAMELMRPYMDESSFGKLALYAQYHFGMAAFKNGQGELAKSVIEPLAENKTWEKQEDAKYLLALIYFEEKKNIEALHELSLIKNPDIFSNGERASLNYLKNTSVSFLVANLSKFKDNKGYLIALREQLERQSIMSIEEKAVLKQLSNIDYSFDIPNQSNKNLQILDIAILLPFNYSGGTDVKTISQGNFILELYQGINYALAELIANGTKINVKTYDTQRNNNRLQTILSEEFLLNADVIIGPIYPEETEIVLQFSEKNEIPFINPLSNLDDKIQGYDFAYLFRPAVSSLSSSLLNYLKSNISGKRLAIAYSSASRDEQLANKLEAESKNQGFGIVTKTLISAKNINHFFESLQLQKDLLSKTDAVLILSDDPNIAQATFGYMESKNLQIPVVVMDSWLFFNFASYEMLETQNFVFLGNNSIDFSNPNLEAFRTGFNEQYGKFPSLNMHLGYELVNWIAQTISPAEGFDFRSNLNKNGFSQGKITYGFDFRDSNNNRYVPVLRLNNGNLEDN
ncbi:ABC transporter substrate-binding protein [Aquiflexum sp. LQ15W]|uniref:ABC transporter substrate-binding protein n=1 Tax=Cognataquiflexum nitidum TaxID=2922272 RepID=UPI001F12F611|nr:ABC transporter substrate-binding protein [Cognataquiflexum nitidum]MCH6201119.1 ABC transporter substrate-binding protein [Cognataquiflexum nitidum]